MPVLDVVVPDSLGAIDECVVVTWLKREGAPGAAAEILVILQAAKIAVELPAPQAGQGTRILAQQGDVVRKGQTLAQLETAGGIPQPARPTAQPLIPAIDSASGRASPVARRLASEHG